VWLLGELVTLAWLVLLATGLRLTMSLLGGHGRVLPGGGRWGHTGRRGVGNHQDILLLALGGALGGTLFLRLAQPNITKGGRLLKAPLKAGDRVLGWEKEEGGRRC